ncbi:MAG: DUF885 family protein, partial [Planctomycetota bacterium]|nr:DUF885 family protein [Planctomycetota bacterium]
MPKFLSLACLVLLSGPALAQAPESSRPAITATMPELIQQWREDKGALERLYPYPLSQARNSAFASLNADWFQRLGAVDFDDLSRRDQIDFLMLSDHLDFAGEEFASEQKREADAAPFLEYRSFLLPLLEAYSAREFSDARECAEAMHAATQAMEDWQARWKEDQADREEDAELNPSLMRRVARTNGRLHRAIRQWYRFEAESHPEVTWWCEAPWKKLDKALEAHSKFLEETIGGIDPDDEDRLIGDPIGRKRLLSALENERIAYSPEELLAIAEKEFAWCDTHRARAATEMGLEGDWRAAQAKVRGIQVEPGEQARLILDMANEATQFFEDRDLVTIPEHCKTTWRMQMMSAERQRFSPYFTGGEVISIAYPTQDMGHEAKLQSMRGNNRHFSRAVVHHELIPGHHLQGYMARRWNSHRGVFRTPFLVE